MAINSIGSSSSMVRGKEFQIDVNSESQNVNNFGISPGNEAGPDNNLPFASSLKEAMGKVNTIQKEADNKIEALVTGQSENLHDTMIAVEKADIAMKLMTQVRNKIIDAYQEIMKMQV